MGDVSKHLLERLTRIFGEVEADDVQGYLAAYERALGRYSDAVLMRAAADIEASFVPSKRHPWPAPALCIKAADKAAGAAAATTPGGEAERFLKSLRQRQARARDFAHAWIAGTEQGRTAAAEGWAHEARIEVAQMHFRASADGSVPGLSEIAMSAPRFDKLRRCYARQGAA